MYLHLGKGSVVPKSEVIAVFDLDNSSSSHITREYLARAEREGRVVSDCDDLPKSFVVTNERVYLSQLSSATLMSRWENHTA
ncbi:MAG TPA: DUF370 domain-containing protein [Firmicutes bacterium]|nr:DUF370 domain-containing protein [Bacillota bacterium]